MAAISDAKSLSLLMDVRKGGSASAVRLMRRSTKWGVVVAAKLKKGCSPILQIRKGDAMIRLSAIIDRSPIVAICFLCAVGLLISLGVLMTSEYSPAAWF